MSILYYFFATLIIIIATTSLLTKRISIRILLIQLVCITLLLYLFSCSSSQVGVPVMGIQIILILCVIKEYRAENVLLACLGQLVNIAVNNVFCYVIVKAGKISLSVFENEYWFPFCVGYAVFLGVLMFGIRYFIYERLHLINILDKSAPEIRYGLTVNICLYLLIFYITVTMGEQAGYTSKGLLFNCILFGVCMIVSCLLFFQCIRSVKSEGQKKAEQQQQEITGKYIASLENMLEDMRSFKHDYKNLLSGIAGFIQEENIDGLRKYFSNNIQNISVGERVQTKVWKGLKDLEPMELKGFLYEKVLLAMSCNLNITVFIEENMHVVFYDMNTLIRILGIFLDNAIEEAELADTHAVTIFARHTERGFLFIIENDYKDKPDLSQMSLKGYSTRGEGRGMGLYWVDKIVKKRQCFLHTIEIQDGKVIQKIEVIKLNT